MGLDIDNDLYPIVVTTWEGASTVADADRYIAHYEELTKQARTRNELLFFVTDVRDVTNAPPLVRQRFGTWIAQRPLELNQTAPVNLVLMRGRMMRGVLTAVAWVAGDLGNTRPVADFAQAKQVIRAQCHHLGLPVPATLERLGEPKKRSRQGGGTPASAA
ncbi:MAG: hypothetical protein KC619_13480 [Myxococcales bacterium]|nr:hypothetical protein [Myxococcales bacterium]